MGEGGKICVDLVNMLSGWEFIFSDSRGRSSGLILGWRPSFFHVIILGLFP
jgi:hypothetical protein